MLAVWVSLHFVAVGVKCNDGKSIYKLCVLRVDYLRSHNAMLPAGFRVFNLTYFLAMCVIQRVGIAATDTIIFVCVALVRSLCQDARGMKCCDTAVRCWRGCWRWAWSPIAGGASCSSRCCCCRWSQWEQCTVCASLVYDSVYNGCIVWISFL